MQRILHINDYPVGAGGGAEVVMGQTIDLLRGRGLAVESFTAADLADARRTPLRYLNNPAARHALAGKLERFRPDIVHLHNFYHVLSPGILAELERYKKAHSLRVVMTAHDYHLVCPNSGGNWFGFRGGKWGVFDRRRIASTGYLLSRSWDQRNALISSLKLLQHLWSYRWHHLERAIDMVICPSRFVQELIAGMGLKSCWLPHPAAPSTPASKNGRGRLQMVFAGRLEPEKGLNEFLELWPDDLDADLTVIGAGRELERCRQTCAARNLETRVRFLGRLSHEQTVEEIARCHLLVLPSRFMESYGLVLIEALSAGTNVLASDRGAAREIVESAGAGFLYDLDEPESLRRQLRAVGQRHAEGTLNAFDPASLLQERSATRYLASLLEAYDFV